MCKAGNGEVRVMYQCLHNPYSFKATLTIQPGDLQLSAADRVEQN